MSTHCPIRIIVCVLQSFDFILSLLRYHAITLLTKSKVSNWTQDRLFLNEKVTSKKQNQNYLKPCVPCLVIFFLISIDKHLSQSFILYVSWETKETTCFENNMSDAWTRFYHRYYRGRYVL